MPIPVDIVAKINRRSFEQAADGAKRAFADAGRDIGKNLDRDITRGTAGSTAAMARSGQQLGGEFKKGLTKGIGDAFSGVASQFGVASKQADSMFSGIISKATPAGLAVGAIGAAAVIVGKQFYDLGSQWDDVADSIAIRTGKLGEELKTLTDSVKDVARSTASPIEDIGDVAGRVSQSLHLTGKPLQDMITNVSNLNEMTGEKLNIRELGKAMRVFKVDIEKNGVDILNQLNTASQNTGIPLNDLIKAIGDAGPAARDFNLSMGETAALIASFEEIGIDENAFRPALQRFAKTIAKDGGDVRLALEDTINKIATLPEDAARKLASESFGKTFEPIFLAIRNGDIDVQALNTTLGNTGPTIDQLRDATADWTEEWTTLINTMKVELAPVAESVFSQVNEALHDTTQTIREEIAIWVELWRSARNAWDELWPGARTPSGPETLDANGNRIPTGQPPGGPNPLTGQPGSAVSGSPGSFQSPLDVFAPTTPGSVPGVPGARGGPTFGGNAMPGNVSGPLSNLLGGGGVGAVTSNGGTPPSPASVAAISRAQALSGSPYEYGALDCSGYLSEVYSAMTGKSARFTTVSDFEALGFHRGSMPGALNIGVTPLPGKQGHMAGTLPNGVNIESGGTSGGATYGSSTGAGSKQFSEQWWFMPGYAGGGDVNPFAPGGPGGWMQPYDPDHPVGGGNINPNMRIDTGMARSQRGLEYDKWLQAVTGKSLQRGQYPDPNAMQLSSGLNRNLEMQNWMLLQGIISPSFRKKMPAWPPPSGMNYPKPEYYGTGGTPHGASGIDNIPAMLTAGEHVLTKDDVNALGGQDGVYQLRSMLHRNSGGAAGWGDILDPTSQAAQMGDSFLTGMSEGGGYGGMISSFVKMGIDAARSGRQGTSAAPGGAPGGQPGPPQPTGRSLGEGQNMGGGGNWQVPEAASAALGALDVIAPGAGMGAQKAAQLGMRAIQFGGQAATILGIQAPLETFLPNGSPLGDPMANWGGRIAMGVSGVRPAKENQAGQSTVPMQAPAGSPASGQGAGPAPGPAIGQVNFNSPVQDQSSMVRDIDRQINAHGAGMAP